MQFVLDFSIAISWCLVDENNDYANCILSMMLDSEAFVPGIWSLEVANTLVVAERRNRMTQEQSEEAITLLQSLLIQVDTATDENALDSTLKLARQQGLAGEHPTFLHVIASATKWSEAIAKSLTKNESMRLLRRSSSQ